MTKKEKKLPRLVPANARRMYVGSDVEGGFPGGPNPYNWWPYDRAVEEYITKFQQIDHIPGITYPSLEQIVAAANHIINIWREENQNPPALLVTISKANKIQ